MMCTSQFKFNTTLGNECLSNFTMRKECFLIKINTCFDNLKVIIIYASQVRVKFEYVNILYCQAVVKFIFYLLKILR